MGINKEIWGQVQTLLKMGISLIPVHDRGDKIKRPFTGWKIFQERQPSEAELFEAIEKYNTTAIAMICGKVSGNIETIDVDVKHWPGIMALLGTEFKALIPDITDKLRIHKTPSGGFHLIYRVSDGTIPGNKKLCYGMNDDGSVRKEAAIETRGEGGYVLIPPSLGYEFIKNKNIPTITWDERCMIVAICESFNKKITPIVEKKPSKADIDYYDENPFEHFKNSGLAEKCLPWHICRETKNHIYFTRPGKKSGVSATFNFHTRCYYFFTSSTSYMPSKGYTPGRVFAIENHNGDMKAAYRALVEMGFGKIKPHKEKIQAERLARANKPPLPNFSEQAKILHEQITEKNKSIYPFGTYWIFDDEERCVISRENIQCISAELGFCLYKNELRIKDGQIIKRVDTRFFIDKLKEYIKEEDADVYEKIASTFEAFMERHCNYTITRLPIITTREVVSDTKTDCFKLYSNGVVHISKDGYSLIDYSVLDGFILEEKLLNRNFVDNVSAIGRYTEFLDLAIGITPLLKQTIGYLAHDYRDSSQGWIVVLSEKCADSKDGGGAGKSAFCELLKPITGVLVKNAVQFTYDERSFGSWNGERIFVVADAPKDFRYDWLKESATGTLTVRKMHKDAVEVPTELAPKFLVNTNHSFVSSDGGMDRRVIPIEFTNFFNRNKSIDQHFGGYFPNDFNESDWTNYDNFIINCIVEFFNVGKLHSSGLSEGGREKQLRQKHGNTTYEFVMDNLEGWRQRGRVPMHEIKELLHNYCNENSIAMNYRPSMQRVGSCTKDLDSEVIINVNVKINGAQKKCYKWPSYLMNEEEGGDLPY